MRVDTAMVQPAELTESQIVADCRRLVGRECDCKWKIGQHSHDWTQRHAKGRTDEDFARLVGLTQQQVQIRRQVWGMFGDVYPTWDKVSWSHYREVLTWPDAEEWLAEANDNGWSVSMMKRMRGIRERVDNGDDLTEPADADDEPEINRDQQTDEPEHVADADPYQREPSIVLPTPRDFPADPEPPAENVARQPEQASGADAIRAAIESIAELVEAVKPKADGMQRKLFAAKLRRWADELDGDSA
jgi:hypothetical protein